MGFVSAIPLGPTQIEIAKRALGGKITAAMMVVLGSVTSDVTYGAIAVFGVAPFLTRPPVIACFRLFGALILTSLAVITFRQADQGEGATSMSLGGASNRLSVSLATGFFLALTNPMMIIWWLTGEQFLLTLELVKSLDQVQHLAFLLGGGLGLATYLTALTKFLNRAQRFISPRGLKRIALGLTAGLLALAVWFAASGLVALEKI